MTRCRIPSRSWNIPSPVKGNERVRNDNKAWESKKEFVDVGSQCVEKEYNEARRGNRPERVGLREEVRS